MKGIPALVVICENKKRWPNSTLIYISEPYPNVELYEKYIRPVFPDINRPMPEQIDAIRDSVSSLGIITIQAKSANIDGIHLDPESVVFIIDEITKVFSGRKFHPLIISRE